MASDSPKISDNDRIKAMINDDQKIRIILSSSAQMTITDDMDIFGVDKRNQFINTILNNYFKHAKASLLIYRTNRISALCDTSEDEHMSTEELENKEAIVTDIVDAEIREYANNIKKNLHIKGNRRFCYINKYNMKFLEDNGYKEYSGECGEHYMLREKNGKIAIYKINEKQEEEIYENTEISVEYLAEADKVNIKNGIRVNGKEELNQLIEDFE